MKIYKLIRLSDYNDSEHLIKDNEGKEFWVNLRGSHLKHSKKQWFELITGDFKFINFLSPLDILHMRRKSLDKVVEI